MRKAIFAALINLTLTVSITPCFGQTAEQINLLLKRSKFVDTGRTVNTTVGVDKTIISTYSNPKASDQDCKVTALLMMKELKQHYKSIHRIQVLFYDQRDPRSFRDVEIREGDVLLVDEGKSPSVVLSQIDVGHHASAPPLNAVPFRRLRPTLTPSPGKSAQMSNNSTLSTTGYQTYKSLNDVVVMNIPKDWTIAEGDGGFVIMQAIIQSKAGTGTIAFYNHPIVGDSLEKLADMHAAEGKAKHKTFREGNRRIESCNGLPALTCEFFTELPNGTSLTEKAGYIQCQNHIYMLDLITSGFKDSDTNQVFRLIFNSLRIRS